MVSARYSILYSAEIMLFYTLSARYRQREFNKQVQNYEMFL